MLIHIFVALLLDIAAFTVILPLFPNLMKYYHDKHKSGQDEFYGQFLAFIGGWWKLISTSNPDIGRNIDIVLVGGALGSLFALLQFVSSPIIGRISDKIGRKSTLLITMIGNIISAVLWVFSKRFAYFVLARIVGGLSEGNVQLSIAMISDITDEKTRSKGLALVGIAFALGFTFGPAIGAYFATFDLGTYIPVFSNYGINSFSSVAFLSFLLLGIETLYILFVVPETLPLKPLEDKRSSKKATPEKNVILYTKSRTYILLSTFLYLFFFSGMEFTLTFLTYERFKYSNMQQGKLLGFIGILSSLIQGGYVRRMAFKVGEHKIVRQGLLMAVVCSILLSIVGTIYDPFSQSVSLAVAGFCFAFASATVVNGFTALFSLSIEDSKSMRKGELLGYHRSMGQLGRALGPISVCSIYWLIGSVKTYLIISIGFSAVLILSTVNMKLMRKEKIL